MRCLPLTTVVVAWLLAPSVARAGLYYSGERMAELPSQWRGFLLDQRTLRNIAAKPLPDMPPNTARARYQKEAARLEKEAKDRKLTADELADLGAIYIRLGEPNKAVSLLRQAQRTHANHFKITANLGTAWQIQGDLAQAALVLQEAVRLAPEKHKAAEEYQLKLVRLRARQKGTAQQELDDLFGVRYVDDKGGYTPGKIAAVEKKKLPENAVAMVQQLALWLPADGRLLWQLAELSNAFGEVRNAAAIMDGCVTQFNMGSNMLRRNRRLTRALADELAQAESDPLAQGSHDTGQTVGGRESRSRRPLMARVDAPELPPISPKGTNLMPWPLLDDTMVDRKARPTFPQYLKDLDGKTVAISGFMQPLSEEDQLTGFLLIENPVGCWYCETPEMTQMVYVELPDGRWTDFVRDMIRIVGRLSLNADDPENFFFTILDAKVTWVD